MKTRSFLFILLTCLFISCGKKTQVSGTVFSKHKVPVPNVQIAYEEHVDGEPLNSYEDVTRTDANGHYAFDLKASKNYNYFVRTESDSGYKRLPFTKGKSNALDLELE
jgi:hypothetical protein